jgi:hypothetical protein
VYAQRRGIAVAWRGRKAKEMCAGASSDKGCGSVHKRAQAGRVGVAGWGDEVATIILHAPPRGRKHCRSCGIDVAGSRRMRDRVGTYWCYACGKRDSERKHGMRARVPCPRCGKSCVRANMVEHRGLHLCGTCAYDRTLKDKELARQGSELELPHEAEAKERLRNMLVVGAVLAFISLYRWGVIGG